MNGFLDKYLIMIFKPQTRLYQTFLSTAWTGSISFALTYMLSPITFMFCESYGFRISMFIGAALYGLGLLTSSFVPSVPYLYLTFGFIFGVGQSLLFGVSVLILRQYFTRKWSLAHGIALSGNSMGAVALAPAIEVILSKNGFNRGFQIASAASVYLMLISIFFKRPERNSNLQEVTAENNPEKDDSPLLSLMKNKAFITFITATTLMHFGYYIPFVYLVCIPIALYFCQVVYFIDFQPMLNFGLYAV